MQDMTSSNSCTGRVRKGSNFTNMALGAPRQRTTSPNLNTVSLPPFLPPAMALGSFQPSSWPRQLSLWERNLNLAR